MLNARLPRCSLVAWIGCIVYRPNSLLFTLGSLYSRVRPNMIAHCYFCICIVWLSVSFVICFAEPFFFRFYAHVFVSCVVCLSFRPSVTPVYCVETSELIIKQLALDWINSKHGTYILYLIHLIFRIPSSGTLNIIWERLWCHTNAVMSHKPYKIETEFVEL